MMLKYFVIDQARLSLSNRPKLTRLVDYKSQGVQRLVTILGHNEMPRQLERTCQQIGIEWTWIPVGHGKIESEHDHWELQKGLCIVCEKICSGEWIHIHCSAGIHRTGTLAHAILIQFGYPSVTALEIIRFLRPECAAGLRENHLAWGSVNTSSVCYRQPNELERVLNDLKTANN